MKFLVDVNASGAAVTLLEELGHEGHGIIRRARTFNTGEPS